MRKIDLKGQRFGRLTVVEEHGFVNRKFRWKCLCDCGTVKLIRADVLRSGASKSCGCLSVENTIKRSTKHGMKNSPEFSCWSSMMARCEWKCRLKDNKKQKNYSGRGVKVCERWAKSFALFLKDMGPRPSLKHSIDRIDTNGDYEPGNCRWATQMVQANNKRSNNLITFKGVTMSARMWDREAGLRLDTVARRIRSGWSIEKAITEPPRWKGLRCIKNPRSPIEVCDHAHHTESRGNDEEDR